MSRGVLAIAAQPVRSAECGMKYLLWALLLYLGWRWYLGKKSAAASEARAESNNPSQASTAAPQSAQSSDSSQATQAHHAPEKMVACAQCGIHLPLSESVTGTGALYYCSEDHRARHANHPEN